jgi:hypothetical protein
MIGKLAQLVGVPTWAIKIGLAIVAALLLLWAYAAWRDSVIDDYEAEMQADVQGTTDAAEKKADAQMNRAVQDAMVQMESDRKEIQNAKQENRSPLDALFD